MGAANDGVHAAPIEASAVVLREFVAWRCCLMRHIALFICNVFTCNVDFIQSQYVLHINGVSCTLAVWADLRAATQPQCTSLPFASPPSRKQS